MDAISYEGIDEAVLIHALYHGTRPLGMGVLHDRPGLSVKDVVDALGNGTGGFDESLYIDYLAGRPLKVRIDTKAKTVTTRLYDRDAGDGACQRIVERLLDEATRPEAVAK